VSLFRGIAFTCESRFNQERRRKRDEKFIALSILGLLIMGFSATVYAQPKLTFLASGYIEVMTILERNRTPGANGNFATFWPANGFYPPPYPTSMSGAWNRKVSYWEERMRLNFSLIMDKSLSGTVGFEMDSGRMGEGWFILVWARGTLTRPLSGYVPHPAGLPI
jgi:hypothetical protein